MRSNKARFVRRRKTALMAVFVLVIILILIIVLIIAGVTKKDKKDKNSVNSVATPVPTNALSTIIPTDNPEWNADKTSDPSKSPAPTPTATSSESGTQMYVTGDGVNVRKSASSSADVITKLAKNTSVTAYGTEGDFYKIKTPSGEIGYMSKNFLSTSQSTATATPTAPAATPDTSKSTTMYVKGSDVNVRDKASSSGNRLTRLSNGTKVTAYAESNGWTYIQYASGKYGYISSSFLTAKNATATPTAAASTPTPTPAHATDLVSIIGKDYAARLGTVSEKYLNDTKAGQKPEVTSDYHNYEKIFRIEKISGGAYFIGFEKEGEGFKYGNSIDDFK